MSPRGVRRVRRVGASIGEAPWRAAAALALACLAASAAPAAHTAPPAAGDEGALEVAPIDAHARLTAPSSSIDVGGAQARPGSRTRPAWTLATALLAPRARAGRATRPDRRRTHRRVRPRAHVPRMGTDDPPDPARALP